MSSEETRDKSYKDTGMTTSMLVSFTRFVLLLTVFFCLTLSIIIMVIPVSLLIQHRRVKFVLFHCKTHYLIFGKTPIHCDSPFLNFFCRCHNFMVATCKGIISIAFPSSDTASGLGCLQTSQPLGTIKLEVEVAKPGDLSKNLETDPIIPVRLNLHLNQNVLCPGLL